MQNWESFHFSEETRKKWNEKQFHSTSHGKQERSGMKSTVSFHFSEETREKWNAKHGIIPLLGGNQGEVE